ncbi:MAG: uroporphyrinogen decarboxylase family protein [Armatimonadota bacterium]
MTGGLASGTSENTAGKRLVLDALSGRSTERIPATVMTWGFDYLWEVAGLEPWQLALGSSEMYHRAHMAMYERHRPDIIWYSGGGYGPEDPVLLSEDAENWTVRNPNSGRDYLVNKTGLGLTALQPREEKVEAARGIHSREDADRVVPEFTGWGETYLNGLRRLITELGDRALVLPNYCTSYIATCYLLGFERSMEMMLTDPDLFLYICERHRAGEELRMRELAEAGCEAVLIADAWASCDIISPEMFRRFALPYQASFAEACRKAGLKCILWNEGDVIPILDLEAQLDYDAFAFEQPRKTFAVTVKKVREVFGADRCLMGNVDSEELLGRNDPSSIRAAVWQQIQDSGPGAPFIVSTGSPLPSGTPPEAVDAALAAAREFRW